MSPKQLVLRAAGAALVAAAALPAALAAQTSPPPLGPTRPFTLPRPAERTLANGLRVVVAEQHDVPLVAAQLVVRTGAEADPAELSGLADFVATLVHRGAQAVQMTQAVQAMGGTLSAGAEWDYSRVGVSAPASRFPGAAELMAGNFLAPALAEADVRTLNNLAAQRARNRFVQPLLLAEYAAARLLFGSGGYAHPLVGTPQSVARITRDDVARFHAAHYRPDNAVLVLAGDIRPEAGFALAERLYGKWAKPSTPLPAAPRTLPGAAVKPSAVLVDVPNMEGASMVAAVPGVGIGDAEYFRSLMASTMLGGGYTARLSRAARVDRALADPLRTWVDARRRGGVLYASAGATTENAPELASLLVAAMGSLGTAAADSEMVARRGWAAAQLARDLQTVDGLAAHVAMLAGRGVPLDRVARYGQEIQGVAHADVQRFAGARGSPAAARLVVVGDGAKLRDELRRRFPDLSVISSDEVDLGAPDLRSATRAGGTQ